MCGDILLISGYRRHGKDTLCDHLTGRQNCFVYYPETKNGTAFVFPDVNYRRVAFADVLKAECSVLLDLSLAEIEELKDKPLPEHSRYVFKCVEPASSPPTVRDVLIDYGAYCRSTDINYFCARVAEQALNNKDCITVVTDFRYVNECNYLKEKLLGTFRRAVTVRIHREGVVIPAISETSEHQLDDFDFDLRIKV